MNKDDVLLTEDEVTKACHKNNESCPVSCSDCEALKKAQCLKLLDFMKQPCENHPIGSVYLSSKWLCGSCNRELEKLLKEQAK